jgi:hypothetical protein
MSLDGNEGSVAVSLLPMVVTEDVKKRWAGPCSIRDWPVCIIERAQNELFSHPFALSAASSHADHRRGDSRAAARPAGLRPLLKGSLGGIDALLGCPLVLCGHAQLEDAAWDALEREARPRWRQLPPLGAHGTPRVQAKEAILGALFYATNWLRELISAFSSQGAHGADRIAVSPAAVLRRRRRASAALQPTRKCTPRSWSASSTSSSSRPF